MDTRNAQAAGSRNETGAARGRNTSPMVRVKDRAAAGIIRGGGLMVLAAMMGICVFLFQSAAPLLLPGAVDSVHTREFQSDETMLLLHRDGVILSLDRGGELSVLEGEDGDAQPVRLRLASGIDSVAAVHFDSTAGIVTVVSEEGRLTQGSIEAGVAPLRADLLPEPVAAMEPGERLSVFDDETRRAMSGAARRSGLRGELIAVWREAGGEQGWWARDLTLEFARPASIGSGEITSLVAVDDGGRSRTLAVARDGQGIAVAISTRRSLRGPGAISVTETALDLDAGRDAWLIPMGGEDGFALVNADGRVQRVVIASTGVLLLGTSQWEGSITSATLALGGKSILVGRADGTVSAYLAAEDAPGSEAPGRDLVLVHRAKLGQSPVTSIATGERDRTIAVGFESGAVVLWNVTAEKVVARVTPEGGAVSRVALAPDLESVAALTASGMLRVAHIEPAHPEASWTALFAPVHYESYDEPTYVYQAEGALRSETKISLMPLIWGTLKATAVAMLIAAPLAVLAALYTSEFMHPDARRIVKPVIELMASLPSVVLGFIAAMVVAPWMRDHLPGFLAWLLAAPVATILGAQAWRAVPPDIARRVRTVTRLVLIGIILLASMLLSAAVGPALESMVFGESGSFRLWLDDADARAYPGWIIALIPVTAVLVVLVDGRLFGDFWTRLSQREGARSALVGLVRTAVQCLVALGLALGTAWALSFFGADPRDSVFGSGEPPNFFQRNTLVVGIVMGFAVIPIIYTISEDAMRAVPEGLRAASLGCGATPWQTATRVVLPVAASGVFSACMVGLGRAVGETMIVLMATGNTPLMEWNIFSGVRTLAANIAVELPEAPRGGTHYRVLFLCGLVLFVMTLLVNTTAEIVRQRFRKRSAAL